jgi:acyl transferase domain-containing protein/NADP-dependent 3-hydroxy acid dehydrogenase YdfG/aryl carrier-like protein
MEEREQGSGADIAIIGMACRFPGAANPAEYWQLLRDGREARTELTDDQLRAAGVPEALLADPNYVRAGMFLDGVEQFDAGFFGFSPLDARIMDPQHRHFLECSWEALENAGYDPARSDAAIGVFAGSGHNAYLPYNLLTNPDLVDEVGFFLLRHTGNDKDFLATRVSYCFDLKGPSVNVQTACSTSLVAVHQAAQSLLNGECDMALAGGVTIEMPHHQGYLFKESEILSPDGHCRPFDASAGGTVFGSGVGVLLLKRLDDALADGDFVHAVIKSSAVNNDGAGKVSYLAPSVDGQAAAVQEALAIGEIDPASVTYIECHGTGTSLGDPIEVAALTQAYGADNPRRQYCGIGSVKSNIGHLDTAAGVASLIKVILALQHRQLPATLHYQAPNPAIDFPSTPFYVNAELQPWNAPSPLRAGVSSLGVGGTNAHLIVEEAPPRPAAAPGRAQQLLLLSARSEEALRGARERLAAFLREQGDAVDLADVAYTLAVGRRHFRQRGALVVADRDGAAAILDGSATTGFSRFEAPEVTRRTAFMFAGGGAQYPNMGRGLYDSEPLYRQVVDDALTQVAAFVDFDLRALLFPEAGGEAEAARQLQRPSRALPALFITQYAQARLWQAWGIEPAALLGHSMGENTAACLAGVFSLRDALGLVALRGRLFERLPAGGMLSVQLGVDALRPLLEPSLDIAAVNAPELTVVSGPVAALDAFEQRLHEHEIGCQRIHIDVAAHSAMLEPILAEFENYLRSIRLQPPQLPFLSNLSGDWIRPEQAMDPRYWVQHLRHTVRFADGVGRLLADGEFALLEVGPGRTLTSLAALHDARRPEQPLAISLRHPGDDTPDLTCMLTALGRLWQGGVEPDWQRFFDGQQRRRVPLPTYAFEHRPHWVEPGAGRLAPTARDATSTLFQPVWMPAAQGSPPLVPVTRAIVIADPQQLASLRPLLAPHVGSLVELTLPPEPAALVQLGDELQRQLNLVETPSHIYLMQPARDDGLMSALLPLYSVARALGESDRKPAALQLLTTASMRLPGDVAGSAVAPALAAALRVVSAELDLPAALVDLPREWSAREVALLMRERPAAAQVGVFAYRGGRRLCQQLQPVELPVSEQPALREGGVYLITGGFGDLGLALARHLAQRPVRLALLGRALPPQGELADFCSAAGGAAARRLEQLRELEKLGAEVMLLQADVADRAALADAVASIERRWGVINGVFHTAGVLDDALLPMKELDAMRAVLAPKVDGAHHLLELLADRSPDFLLFYSSTSALAGLPGQFDYAAANGYLDGLAQQAAGNVPLLSIDWPVWQEIGMAARLAGVVEREAPPPTARRVLLQPDAWHCIVDGRDWEIEQHRTRAGATLLPGTGFVEIACRAAAARLPGDGALVLRELVLLQPLLLTADQRVVVSVRFEADGAFSIVSSDDADAALRGRWRAQHAQGRAERGAVAAEVLPLAPLRARCSVRQQPAGGRIDHPHMAFGPRWHCVESIALGGAEALIELSLTESFRGDLVEHPLHPALLDMAIGGAERSLFSDDGRFFVPQAYRELRQFAPLEADLVSHITVVPLVDGDSRELNIRIADRSGRLLLAIDGFRMRALPGGLALPQATGGRDELQALLQEGIRPAQALPLIERLLAAPGLPQLAVLPHGPAQLARRMPAPVAKAAQTGGGRPVLSSDYVAPTSELERGLVELWQKALGMDQIGVRDDFFELGGHSLLLIQLVNRARKQLGVDLPLSQLFGKPTVADWVALLGQATPRADAPAKPVLKRVQRDAYRAPGE